MFLDLKGLHDYIHQVLLNILAKARRLCFCAKLAEAATGEVIRRDGA
jgi:hypothetical protein